MIQDFTNEELMSLSTKDVLIFINSWAKANAYVMEGGRDKRQALWSVLTALRGPDNADEDAKSCTATQIRDCLRHLAAPHGAVLNRIAPYNEKFNPPTHQQWLMLFQKNSHFAQHAENAFRALKNMGYGPNGWED